MATGVWCELVCGACATAAYGKWVYDRKVPRAELCGAARRDGWKFKHAEAFCSTECLEKFEEDLKL